MFSSSAAWSVAVSPGGAGVRGIANALFDLCSAAVHADENATVIDWTRHDATPVMRLLASLLNGMQPRMELSCDRLHEMRWSCGGCVRALRSHCASSSAYCTP